MRNPLRNEPKIVRIPSYMLMVSAALLIDAVIFIEVAEWLSLLTFLIAFLIIIPSVAILTLYIVYKSLIKLRLNLARTTKPGGYIIKYENGKQKELVEVVIIGMVIFILELRYYNFSLGIFPSHYFLQTECTIMKIDI